MNLLEKEAAHQRAKYLKYNNPDKAFAKKKTRKEDTFILDDTSDRSSLSISGAHNSRDEYKKTSIAYNSDSGNNNKSSNIFNDSEENNWNNGYRDGFIIEKLKNNSISKIIEHKLSYNNLNKALHDAHLLNTLQ